VHASDPDFWEICLRKWITAMVASLLDVEVVNHTVIVFTGPQGIGKTTWLLKLVPAALKKYHYSGTVNPTSRDTLMHLVECMEIVVDDLESMTRAEHSALKELITKSGIRQRRVFGVNNEYLQRRASFCGSVNTGQFLSDTTGNRRFLCIEVDSIDYRHHVDMDLVMAQALALYKSGFQYWFDRKEIGQLTVHNEEFVYAPVIDEMLMVCFEPVKEALRYMDEQYLADNHILKLTATQIAARIAEKTHITINNGSTVSLGKALRKYGFVRFKHKDVYVYLVKEVG
jgi:predicted P-loop ATPase